MIFIVVWFFYCKCKKIENQNKNHVENKVENQNKNHVENKVENQNKNILPTRKIDTSNHEFVLVY